MFSNLKPIYDKKTGQLHLIGKQGSTWSFVIKLKDKSGNPIDLSSVKEVRGQIRKKPSAVEVVKSWVCQIIDASQGTISISLSSSDTAQIAAGDTYDSSKSTYYYDIEIEDENGNVSRILQGKLFVDPEVTK